MLSEEILKKRLIEKKSADRPGSNYLFDEDLEVCNYVLNQIPYIDLKYVDPGKSISLNELIENSLNEMIIFGDDIYLKVYELMVLKGMSISMDYDYFLKFRTLCKYGHLNGEFIDHEIKYIIPKRFYELSVFLFSHEHIHLLKGSDYNEIGDDMILSEVISLFYELIIFSPNDEIKKELMRCRLSWLLSNRNEFVMYDNFIKNHIVVDNCIDREENFCERGGLYDYFRSKVGCYLNSFYYAMILYHMYKESPKKILNLISRVLKQELTIYQMLEMLGLYGDIRGDVFEKEFNNIKKLVK